MNLGDGFSFITTKQLKKGIYEITSTIKVWSDNGIICRFFG